MERVRIDSEFGTLRAAIVHDGRNAVDLTMDNWRSLWAPEHLAAHPEAGPSSRERLIAQHARLRALLADNGVALLAPECEEEACGQVFTRDPCFAIGDTVFIGCVRDDWRIPEIAGLRELRHQFPRVIDLAGHGAIIEGGDVMIVRGSSCVLVGMNRHTNEVGFRKLAGALAGSGAEVVCVPHEGLHLDCCLAPLPNGEALYCPRRLRDPWRSNLGRYFDRLIPLDPDEADRYLAANLLWLDARRVVSSVMTTNTNGLLREKGYDVIEVDFADLISQCGGVRCAVCPIVRGD
jgi:N-dimethylarginine dimethylaminohydrolase